MTLPILEKIRIFEDATLIIINSSFLCFYEARFYIKFCGFAHVMS